MKYFSLFLFAFFFTSPSFSQEFDCAVSVDMTNISERFRENVSDLKPKIEDYINNYRWTGDDWSSDKINCTMSIVLVSCTENFKYSVNVFLGTQRPIYKSKNRTVEARIADDKWEFTFARNQRFDHSETRFDEMTSFIDFYMYLLLGIDFDTYKKRDGTKCFQKALNIATLAGSSSKGWDAMESGSYNRSGFVNELLNPSYAPLRDAIFTYHYDGLDLLAEKPNVAKKNILSALESIAQLRSDLNARSNAMKVFFDTKYLEIAETFATSNDANIYLRLNLIDPTHQKTYDEYRGNVIVK